MLGESQKDQANKDLKEPLLSKDYDNMLSSKETRADTENNYLKPPPQQPDHVTYSDAMRKIFNLAIYPIIGMIFHPAYHICNSIILGNSPDSRLLGALGLGGLTQSIFLLSIGISFNGSLDTLIAQAFGAKDKKLCWIYMNRQLYLTTLVYFPLAIPVFFCEYAFLALGQDPYVSQQAAIYVRICIPGILAYTWASCCGRFLTGQRVTHVNIYSNVGASLVHFALAYLLAVKYDFGMYGVAIASSIHFVMRFVIVISYIKYSGRFNEGYVPINDAESFKNWGSQIKLCLQCASLGIWSWWAFDIFTLIASYMSIDELASQTVLRNIGLLTYMIPVGIAIASSVLVGNMIGAKNIEGAKVYAKMCTLTAFIWAIGSVLFINVLQDAVIQIFASSPSVIQIIQIAFPIISFFVFFDCTQGVGQGIIRGLGKQGVASWVTIVGYWVLGIPISLIAVFYLNGGIVGLWVGPTVAIIFNFIFYYLIVLKSDWVQIAIDAEKRRNKDKK